MEILDEFVRSELEAFVKSFRGSDGLRELTKLVEGKTARRPDSGEYRFQGDRHLSQSQCVLVEVF